MNIGKPSIHSIKTKFTTFTVIAIIGALSIATLVGVISISKLGRSDADQMLHSMCATGAMNLESYFDSVENSTETVATLVQESLEEVPFEDLGNQVERARNLFGKVANNTNGVLTYYFRIDPEVSKEVKGFWYVDLDGEGFKEHEVTDISQYDTNDTSKLVWFTVPKATGKGVWLPPYYTENLDIRVISYNVPVYWHDQFVGVIGIEIDYDTLAKEVENIKLYDHGYAFILDEDSNIIYHPQMDSTLHYGEKIAIDEPDRIIGENHIQYNFDGVEKEAVWLPLSNGMRLYVTVPVSETNRGWRSLVRDILVVSLVLLLIVIFLTMRFTDRLTKPLTDLTKAAKQVDEGNYDFTLDYDQDDEVGVLTRTFKRLAEHTEEHISDLNNQVFVDALTSVRNKGAFANYVDELDAWIESSEEPPRFAIGVFDCDNLKMINDKYGHDKGDLYLKGASSLICRVFRHSPVFRIGGDEFAVVLRDEDYQNRDELLAHFREVREEICEKAENEWEQVNVTIGIADYDPEVDHSVLELVRRADKMMYQNKRARKGERQQLS